MPHPAPDPQGHPEGGRAEARPAPHAGGGPPPLFAVLGHPVGHSLSPAMHEAGFAATGRRGRYVPCEVRPERLPAALAGLAALGFAGCNCTVPLKEEACRLATSRSAATLRAGSANTLAFGPDGDVRAATTDGPGLLAALRAEAGWRPAGRIALVLGAGGAARAVAAALADGGARAVVVCNRTAARARAVAEALGSPVRASEGTPEDPRAPELARADLVVNCTSVGMDGAASPLAREALAALAPGTLVADAVYTPREETPLLAAARGLGLPCMGGLPMLAWQAALAWEVWFGEQGPAPLFLAAARAALAAGRRA